MNLTVISHKKVWKETTSPSGFATTGGFPQQIAILADLFDGVTVLVPCQPGAPPPGLKALDGRLSISPLDSLPERGWRRKAFMVRWLPLNIARIWRAVSAAEAVHTPVPGDVGLIGILMALAHRKPLFVRHCGLWGQTSSITARFLLWLLERSAGGPNVVMATGAANQPPSMKNPAVTWIFSTTLTESDWENIPHHHNWRQGHPFRLVTVGRLEPIKNIAVVLQALNQIRDKYPHISLEVVGNGTCKADLQQLVLELDLSDSVIFHGNVSHERVIEIVSRCHLFLMPSKSEGFPKAAVEAMACGLPVVATEVSAFPYLVGTENGLLLEEPTPEALIEAVETLLLDDDRLAAMSKNARQTARHYSLERWREIISQRLTEQWGTLKAKQIGAWERPLEEQIAP